MWPSRRPRRSRPGPWRAGCRPPRWRRAPVDFARRRRPLGPAPLRAARRWARANSARWRSPRPCGQRHLVGQREHLVGGRHHLADGGVAELEDVVDEAPLGHLQLARLRADVDQRAELLLAQAPSGVIGRAPKTVSTIRRRRACSTKRSGVSSQVKRRQRQRDHARPALAEPDGDRLGRHLAEEQDERQHERGRDHHLRHLVHVRQQPRDQRRRQRRGGDVDQLVADDDRDDQPARIRQQRQHRRVAGSSRARHRLALATRDSENSAVSAPAKNADASSSATIATSRSTRNGPSGRYLAGPGASGSGEEEGRAPARLRLDPHDAAVRLDEALDDRQPEPGAAVLAGRAVVDLEEGIEDALLVLGRHADAGVAHRHLDRARARRPSGDERPPPAPTPRPCRSRA